MNPRAWRGSLQWTLVVPVAALAVLAVAWFHHDGPLILAVVSAFLVGAIFAAVHHAEVIAHRVGEPLGSLVLAVAVTVIEVGLIVMLMIGGGPGASTYARDTVFAAVMITLNGIVGISILVSGLRHQLATFNASGSGSALATVVSLAGVCLVLPGFTVTEAGLEYAPAQLAFVAVASVVLYLGFVLTQTVRHRDFFVPVRTNSHAALAEVDHADPPSTRETWLSVGLLTVALVSVVGLAKVLSHPIEDGLSSLGLPHAMVGVVIALLVLAPETLAAVKNARCDRMQTSLNLAYGSALASIGLSIPAVAVAMIWLPGELTLGLEPMQIVLLALSVVISVLTLAEGRALIQQGVVHLALLATFIFFSAIP